MHYKTQETTENLERFRNWGIFKFIGLIQSLTLVQSLNEKIGARRQSP